MPSGHLPVLVGRVVELLSPVPAGLFVDATLGLGGHAAALLTARPDLRLLGLDRDPEVLARAAAVLAPHADRAELVESTFDRLPDLLAARADPPPVAVLADLGCSSLQLDSPGRGFSFLHDGPLDMRMGPGSVTAADLVNSARPEELMRILWTFGEERRARAIVRAVVAERSRRPLSTTGELARLVAGAVGRAGGDRIHPATRTFQALRIAVNDELGQLERFLEPAVHALAPRGRLAVISFHSLEDRIVKHTLRQLAGRCSCPPDLPRCACGARAVVRVLTPRALRPDDSETAGNPRARSARLRAAERLEDDG